MMGYTKKITLYCYVQGVIEEYTEMIKMNKGFQSPNYTQVPNDLFELEMANMGYAELKVVLCIMRQTLGYHRKKVRYQIRKIAEMTGLTEQGVRDGADEAVKHGYIIRTKDGGVTQWELNLQPKEALVQPKEALPPSIKESIKEKSPAPQVSSFLYFGDSDIIEVVEAFHHYFKIEPPFKGQSGFTKWIKDAREFNSACAAHDIKLVMAKTYKAWKKEDFRVYDIGSVLKLAKSVIADWQDKEKLIGPNGEELEI
jgi:phage replication O-like protein O